MKPIPTISIVGRTNVGKSTLFNMIAGRRLAITEDLPGVTRDRSYALVRRFNRPFTIIDTGGLVGEEDVDFAQSVKIQTEIAIAESDLIIAVLDGVNGLHPQDSEVVDYLRRTNKPVVWVVNKCEKKESQIRSSEFYTLGIEEPLCISAAHNIGVEQLIKHCWDLLAEDKKWSDEAPEEENQGIKVAIIGKPNVGKSTLINKMLGEDRLITSPHAGTTRDQIDVKISRNGQDFVIVDTAGLRRKSKVPANTIERFSNLRTLKALSQCDVAVVLIDATQGPPTDQDQKIASLAHERGKALVIVVNKWDAIEKDHKTAKEFKDKLFEEMRFCKYAPVLFISAITGKRVLNVLDKVKEVFETTQTRVKTSELNKILERAFAKNSPPVYRGHPVKLYFATQIEVAPPTFVLFVNHPRALPNSYRRYLQGCIRDHYAYTGSDLRVIIRKRTQREEDAEAA